MPFNRASINDWKTKPGDVRFLDIFVGQNQLDIRTGHMIRSKAKKNGHPFTSDTETGVTWAPVEDAAILGMKARYRSFREMSKVLKSKVEEQIRERYRELQEKIPQEYKVKQGEGSAKMAAQYKKDQADLEELEAAKEAKEDKKSVKEDKKEDKKEGQKSYTKEALEDIKATEADKDEDIKKLNGKPVIYVKDDGKDDLSMSELGMLYIMNARFEEKKWVALAAKFYDQTGKRVHAGMLKQQLTNA